MLKGKIGMVLGTRNMLTGARALVVGASSGIGRAFAIAAGREGAHVAVASRRIALLTVLANEIHGTAHELDITDPISISKAVGEVTEALGTIDILVCSCGVLPFARVEHIDYSTWAEAFAVNTVGPALLMSATLPHLADNAVIVIVTSDEERRTRAGTAAYSASKVAFDEILRSWRTEHPSLRIMRVAVSPTGGTEILRGADRELLEELMDEWTHQGQVPRQLVAVAEVADALIGLVASAFANPDLLTDNVRLTSRTHSAPGVVPEDQLHQTSVRGPAAEIGRA